MDVNNEGFFEQPKQEPVAHLKLMMEHSAWEGRLELSDVLANIDEFYNHPQPKQEPVAWRRYEDGMWVYYETKAWDDLQPLYTHPQPKREPLTDEQIEKIIKAHMSFQMNLAGIRQDFEAAHGLPAT